MPKKTEKPPQYIITLGLYYFGDPEDSDDAIEIAENTEGDDSEDAHEVSFADSDEVEYSDFQEGDELPAHDDAPPPIERASIVVVATGKSPEDDEVEFSWEHWDTDGEPVVLALKKQMKKVISKYGGDQTTVIPLPPSRLERCCCGDEDCYGYAMHIVDSETLNEFK